MKNYQVLATAAGSDFVSLDDNLLVSSFEYMVDGKPILIRALQSYVFNDTNSCILITNKSVVNEDLQNLIRRQFNNLILKEISTSTQGALCTALMGIDYIKEDCPLFVVPGDSIISNFSSEIYELFLNSEIDAGTLVFESTLADFSYARLSKQFKVQEVAEKRVVSKWATTGLFYFRSGNFFIESAKWVLLNNMTFKGDFYVSSALNYLVMSGKNVSAIELPSSCQYLHFKNLVERK